MKKLPARGALLKIMAKEKIYNAENLINNSFWVHFILNVRIPKIEKMCVRLEEIIAENKELCTQKNFYFMSSASAALCIFEMFRNEGNSYMQAYYKTARPMWDYCAELEYKYYRKTKTKHSQIKFRRGIEDKISAGYESPWEISVLKADASGMSFKCTSCFYETFFKKYGIKDIAAMFCYGENIIYGGMKNLPLTINRTLILDDKPCSFIFGVPEAF